MDLKIFPAAFAAIFVAELADKTQLASISLSSKSGKPLSVFLGSAAGYLVVTAVSVVLGSVFARYLKPEIVKYASGGLFILIGALILSGRM